MTWDREPWLDRRHDQTANRQRHQSLERVAQPSTLHLHRKELNASNHRPSVHRAYRGNGRKGKGTMTRLEMFNHARKIALDNGITVETIPSLYRKHGTPGRSRPDIRVIQLMSPVWSESMYAIFLHEAGHILSPTQIEPEIANGLAFLNVSNTFQQQNEIDAWQWAAKNALSWTRHMTDMAVKALQTYGIKL